MSQQTATIGEKTVLVHEPYRPNEDVVGPGVGREDEQREIAAAWMGGKTSLPMAPLLLGEPGVGKNRIVYEIAKRTAKDLYILQGHEDVTAEDLACAVRFSDDPNKKLDYVASPLVTAMHLGGICFIDEIGKIRPRALALLVSVLDERRYIDSTLLGLRVHAHSGFRFIAATNTADLEGNALPEFLRSRMRPVITVDVSPREEIDEIVQKRFPALVENNRPLLEQFWELWTRHQPAAAPTPRDAIYVFNLAMSHADFDALDNDRPFRECCRHEPWELQRNPGRTAVQPKHVELAFQELFVRETRGAVPR